MFTRGGGENVQAVVSGDAQIGLGTGTLAVISAFVKKAPIKIAAAEITGMDAFWYVQANTPMRKLEDLAGKKVAYSRPGASSHMAVLGIADQIKAKGLKPAEPVSLGGIPEVYTARAHRPDRRRLVGGAVSIGPRRKRRAARRRQGR